MSRFDSRLGLPCSSRIVNSQSLEPTLDSNSSFDDPGSGGPLPLLFFQDRAGLLALGEAPKSECFVVTRAREAILVVGTDD